MKRIALISAIAISGLLLNNKADAQIRIHLGLNFAPRPVVYAPARVVVDQQADYCEPTNYDGDEDYYYLPEVDAYYSVPEQCYYYNDGGQWVTAEYLPGAYRDFDWRSARRFEVRAPRPFMHDDYYRSRYNGVTFNGRWDRGYDRAYANSYRADHEQFRGDDHRFDNRNQGNYGNRQFDHNRGQDFDNRYRNDQHMEQNHNFDRGGDNEHFAQNMPQRGGWAGKDNHRSGRF
jgi:hypothetical protein